MVREEHMEHAELEFEVLTLMFACTGSQVEHMVLLWTTVVLICCIK